MEKLTTLEEIEFNLHALRISLHAVTSLDIPTDGRTRAVLLCEGAVRDTIELVSKLREESCD